MLPRNTGWCISPRLPANDALLFYVAYIRLIRLCFSPRWDARTLRICSSVKMSTTPCSTGVPPLNEHEAVSELKSAENFRVLRSKGITVRKTIEVIIATFCIENQFQIIHNDRDFDPMERYLGLKVNK